MRADDRLARGSGRVRRLSPLPMPTSTRKPRSAKPRATKASRPYHHGDLGNALLDAASQVIAEQGVAHLRMRDLTRRIGVSHGAPANHFKDRDALLVALAVQG